MNRVITPPRVLILSYSFSGQTRGILHRLADGLEEEGVEIYQERLQPLEKLRFPIGTVSETLKMMLVTLFRRRVAIKALSTQCYNSYDLVLLAGPTWSYNPSGPVLSLLDRDGRRLFSGMQVMPIISCRGYWRMHSYGLRRLLSRCGARVVNVMVFSHPCDEPWRTVGVFMKLAGKNPEFSRLGRYYKRYGHSKAQFEEAWGFGRKIGRAMINNEDLSSLNFRTRRALP